MQKIFGLLAMQQKQAFQTITLTLYLKTILHKKQIVLHQD